MMFIGSSNNLDYIICEEPVVANGKPISQTNIQVCLEVKLDESLSWASHIDMISKKALVPLVPVLVPLNLSSPLFQCIL